jgi:hypothetical protein
MNDRRGFLARLLGSTAALALGGTTTATATSTAAPLRARDPWDDSWVQRITGGHRQVFDAPDIAEGTVLHQARVFMQGYADVYGTTDADTSAVLVIRHKAIPMVLDDAAWDRYGLGKRFKLKDPASGKTAKRNPFINVQPDDEFSLVWADGGLDKLQARGAIVLACNLALGFFASTVIAKADKVDRDEAKRRAQAALLPGVILQPSGIFAVARAEEAGCHYIQST